MLSNTQPLRISFLIAGETFIYEFLSSKEQPLNIESVLGNIWTRVEESSVYDKYNDISAYVRDCSVLLKCLRVHLEKLKAKSK